MKFKTAFFNQLLILLLILINSELILSQYVGWSSDAVTTFATRLNNKEYNVSLNSNSYHYEYNLTTTKTKYQFFINKKTDEVDYYIVEFRNGMNFFYANQSYTILTDGAYIYKQENGIHVCVIKHKKKENTYIVRKI